MKRVGRAVKLSAAKKECFGLVWSGLHFHGKEEEDEEKIEVCLGH